MYPQDNNWLLDLILPMLMTVEQENIFQQIIQNEHLISKSFTNLNKEAIITAAGLQLPKGKAPSIVNIRGDTAPAIGNRYTITVCVVATDYQPTFSAEQISYNLF